VSWVDLVIAGLVIVATERGLRVGAVRQACTTIGLLVGFVVGSILAPTIALRVSSSTARSLVAIGIVTVFAALGGAAALELGRLLWVSARHGRLSRLDRIGGAVSAALGALIVCWLVAGMLAETSALSLSSAIASSRILTVVDAVMPPLPSVESKVQALLKSTDFPAVFAQIIAPSVPTVTLPDAAATTAALGDATASVLKVTTQACGVGHEGTAFAVALGEYVTAAHVVAGANRVDVGGRSARVVLFDPRNDVAVLRTALRGPAGLVIDASNAASGSPAAVVGFPLDRAQHVTPAAVAAVIDALGRDIYDTSLVHRSLVVVSADVQPGNSGSPLLVNGRVAGMIFSRSLSNASTAYAVTPGTIAAATGRAGDSAVTTGACLSG